MEKVYKELYIGNQNDYETEVKGLQNWSVVHACKEPYHRGLLGYTTRGAPTDHPEYYYAERGDRLYLNIVDAPKPEFIPSEIIDKALDFISEKLVDGKKVLVHCNQGMSRSAVLGLLYMASMKQYTSLSFESAEAEFRKIYPQYNPATGVREYARLNWSKYCK